MEVSDFTGKKKICSRTLTENIANCFLNANDKLVDSDSAFYRITSVVGNFPQ